MTYGTPETIFIWSAFMDAEQLGHFIGCTLHLSGYFQTLDDCFGFAGTVVDAYNYCYANNEEYCAG